MVLDAHMIQVRIHLPGLHLRVSPSAQQWRLPRQQHLLRAFRAAHYVEAPFHYMLLRQTDAWPASTTSHQQFVYLLKEEYMKMVDMNNLIRQLFASGNSRLRLAFTLLQSFALVVIVWAIGGSQRAVWTVTCCLLYWCAADYFIERWRSGNRSLTEQSVRRCRLLALLPILVIPPLVL